jgi:hypothetical protein
VLEAAPAVSALAADAYLGELNAPPVATYETTVAVPTVYRAKVPLANIVADCAVVDE